jgi:hypothetical protein
MIHIPSIVNEKPQSPFLDKKAVMKTFGICISTLNKWLYEEGLKYYKVRSRVFIKVKDLNEWVESYKKEK